MAKFKKSGKFPIAEVGGALAGAIATGLVKKLLDKNAPDLSPTIKGAIITGAGAFLAMQKSPVVKGAGLAMVSVGGYDLVSAFLPAGISGVDDIFLSAPADQSILSAPADQSILSGGDDYAINGDFDSMNGDFDSMNGDFDSMNGDFDAMSGDELIGEEYSINGDE
jgi:hypothetical protein